MAFLDNVKETVTDLAQSGVAKSRQIAEIVKLKTCNLGEEDTIKKAYLEIGRLYYAEHGGAPEGAYVSACEKITGAKANIEANNARIAELKTSGNIQEAEVVQAEEAQAAASEEPQAEEESCQEEPKADEEPEEPKAE